MSQVLAGLLIGTAIGFMILGVAFWPHRKELVARFKRALDLDSPDQAVELPDQAEAAPQSRPSEPLEAGEGIPLLAGIALVAMGIATIAGGIAIESTATIVLGVLVTVTLSVAVVMSRIAR
jgi:hypothetical protein